MIISRLERIRLVLEILRDLQIAELVDGRHAEETGHDEGIYELFYENAEHIEDAVDALEKVR